MKTLQYSILRHCNIPARQFRKSMSSFNDKERTNRIQNTEDKIKRTKSKTPKSKMQYMNFDFER